MPGQKRSGRRSTPYASDADRWRAVMARDSAADGAFVYSVRTTGIYCRPSCPARRALRANVRFHADCRAAEGAGYRPCSRCQPQDADFAARHAPVIAAACRQFEATADAPSLAQLAREAGLSPSHFHRLFRSATGTTPKRYALARRAARVASELADGHKVITAQGRAGISSASRFYESTSPRLGMLPKQAKAGGAGTTIRYACGECWLGTVLVAATERGICAILIGDEPAALIDDLATRFPRAERIAGDKSFQRTVRRVVAFLAAPAAGLDLPLDIQGTAFECRVWEALQAIPPGETLSYTQIAERLGIPKSARAVAKACAANKLAVAIPCHRVVRGDGSLAGYRWGIERKGKLLKREGKGK